MCSAAYSTPRALIVFFALTVALSATLLTGDELRRPVAVVATNSHLLVANRCGSVTQIQRASLRIEAEFAVAERLADLQVLPDDAWLLTIDESQHRIHLLHRAEKALTSAAQLDIPHTPVSICLAHDGQSAAVASLWARQLTLLDIDTQGKSLTKRNVVDLPFTPRLQLLAPDGRRLVVADSFGGQLGIVDLPSSRLVAIRTIDGHNIRGLASSNDGERLLIAHQTLNPRVPTVRQRIFWGAVLSNVLTSVRWDEVLKTVSDVPPAKLPKPVEIHHWRLYPLGEPGRAAGDPGGLAVAASGEAVVCLSGVNEVAVRNATGDDQVRLAVGRRPTAVALDPTGETAYVCNTHDDSISVIDIAHRKVAAVISLGPTRELNLADVGEQLFFNARLSLDGWNSCHSCHTDGHTNGRLNDNLSDGTTGTPKRILSLLGTSATGPWAWDGHQSRLQTQLANSIRSTMQGKEEAASEANLESLEAYLQTLEPPPSLAAARGRLDRDAIERGRRTFNARLCSACHQPSNYTTPDRYDVDLVDEQGASEFNPPSLLGVSQRGPYLHDNRAAGLREVFTQHHHGETKDLQGRALEELLAFLKSL
jgi:YVTN family beta-propeller protein